MDGLAIWRNPLASDQAFGGDPHMFSLARSRLATASQLR